MSAIDQQPVAPVAASASDANSRVSRWIEDPFASVIAGIIIPAFAVALLLSSMAGLSSLLAV